jgi:hypothetical protein
MMSEHFAAHSFFKDSRKAREPVLKQILQLVARDEVRHCQFGYDLLAQRLQRDPSQIEAVLEEAANFHHIGELVLTDMPVSEKNDFAAIVTIHQKIQRLTGRSIPSHSLGPRRRTRLANPWANPDPGLPPSHLPETAPDIERNHTESRNHAS